MVDELASPPVVKKRGGFRRSYTILRAQIIGFFETYCVDFASQFKPSKTGKRFVLISVEHLTGWPIASVLRI